MHRILAPSLALIVAVWWHCTCAAMWEVSDTGDWPKSWPAELEPLREQSRTLYHSGYTMYHLPFTDRAQFEAVWPHLLSVATDQAPLTLWRGHDRWTAVDFDAGVVIFTPNTGQLIVPGDKETTIYGPEMSSAIESGEVKIEEGTFLKVGPPWPESIRDDEGRLPEYVFAEGLQWKAATPQEIRDDIKKAILARRARIEIRLIVDGRVVDLNRIQLPDSVIDKRFNKKANP